MFSRLLRSWSGRVGKSRSHWVERSRTSVSRGSWQWLVLTEQHFGGVSHNVRRRKVSVFDPRSAAEVNSGGMTGGDRMFDHGYAPFYARHLAPWVAGPQPANVVEVGILRGTGLAMWSDLFPSARIIGLDIDPSHFFENEMALTELGAFRERKPDIHVFDQFQPDHVALEEVLRGERVEIVVDDGFHSAVTIRNTFLSLRPFLAKNFAYFIEDNCNAVQVINPFIGDFTAHADGDICVIKPHESTPGQTTKGRLS